MSKISPKNIAEAIYKSAKGKNGKDLDDSLALSVQFLAKKNLLSKTPEILKNLEKISNDDQNIVVAKVESADELTKYTSDELRHALKKRYKAEDVVLHVKENKNLIGGVRIEANDEIIDLSLKNKVDQLQNHLLTH